VTVLQSIMFALLVTFGTLTITVVALIVFVLRVIHGFITKEETHERDSRPE